jgi:hypothetical protein
VQHQLHKGDLSQPKQGLPGERVKKKAKNMVKGQKEARFYLQFNGWTKRIQGLDEKMSPKKINLL